MSDEFDIDSLLADILDESKPLPTGKPALAAHAAVAIEHIEVALSHGPLAPPVITTKAFTDTPEDTTRIVMPTFTSDDMTEVMDLRNFANLVTLNTARWHAKAKDKQASRDVAAANDANANAFETRKHLLAGADEKLKAVHKAIDAARGKHYEMTVPWTTTGMEDVGRRTGARLLPNSMFFEYTEAMATARQAMVDALDEFVPEYPQLIEQARKQLGKRFDIREYPNAESIRSHFDLSFDFQPVPTGTDFKGLPKQQLDALARHLNSNTRKMVENAMQDVWSRLHDAVSRMVDRLSSPDKVFHYTLIENVRETARLVKHLNVTEDKRVESIRANIERHLCPHDVKELRENATLRNTVAGQAATILQQINAAGVGK